jgi:hypothetical protein
MTENDATGPSRNDIYLCPAGERLSQQDFPRHLSGRVIRVVLYASVPRTVYLGLSSCVQSAHASYGELCSATSRAYRPKQDDRPGHRCEALHLLRPSIALSSSSSERGEIPSERNPGSLSEAEVSICISST